MEARNAGSATRTARKLLAYFFLWNLQLRCPRQTRGHSHGFAHPLWIWQQFPNLESLTKHNVFDLSTNTVGVLNPDSCSTTTLLRTLQAGSTCSAKRTMRKLRATKIVREGLRAISEFGPRSLGPRGLFCNSYTVVKPHTNLTTITHFWWRLIQCANCRTDLQTPICT